MTQSWSAAGRMHPEMRGKQVMGYSIRTNRYRYTEWGAGEYGCELYDYQNDPEEYTNLAGKTEYAEIEKEFTKLMKQKRKAAADIIQQKL